MTTKPLIFARKWAIWTIRGKASAGSLLLGGALLAGMVSAQRASVGAGHYAPGNGGRGGSGMIDVGRPSYVQPPTGGPVLPPAITDSHAYRLGAAISGRPIPGIVGGSGHFPRPGNTDVIVGPGAIVGPGFLQPGFGGPVFGYPYGGPGYWAQPAPNGPIMVQQQTAVPLPVVSVNPDYKPDTAKPVLIEYFAQSPSSSVNASTGNATGEWKGSTSGSANPATPGHAAVQPTKQHVVALRSGELFKVLAYWTEGEQVYYIKPDHTKGVVRRAEVEEIRSW